MASKAKDGRRGTYIEGPRTTTPPRRPTIEAARFLANVARRYVADRVLPRDVDEAVEAWNTAKLKEGAADEFMSRAENKKRPVRS
jgi:hypothetical protein